MILDQAYQYLNKFLGLEIQQLTFWHMILRSMIVFVLGIAIIKINKRFIGQRNEFNFILFIMLGSILATSITGNAPFFAVLDMVIFLLILNWFLAKLSFHFRPIEKILKGEPSILVKNGGFQLSEMSRHSITHNDLYMHLRLRHGSDNFENVEMAYLEPNGAISFILKK